MSSVVCLGANRDLFSLPLPQLSCQSLEGMLSLPVWVLLAELVAVSGYRRPSRFEDSVSAGHRIFFGLYCPTKSRLAQTWTWGDGPRVSAAPGAPLGEAPESLG